MLVLGASLVGVGLAGWWAARRISAPIQALGEAVDRLGAGEDAQVEIEGTAEVRRLQHGFNLAARALLDSRNQLESRIVMPPPNWPARTSSSRSPARPRRGCWPPPATTCGSRCMR